MKYGRGKFNPSKEYIHYIEQIANSAAYSGLPGIRNENGKINWQCSNGKTTSFYRYFEGRLNWWIQKADQLGLPGSGKSQGRLTTAARIIHPTKEKVCLVCGKPHYIGYMYLNEICAKRFNSKSESVSFYRGMPIPQAINLLEKHLGINQTYKLLKQIFPERITSTLKPSVGNLNDQFFRGQHIKSNYLSPGFMGDCPHRLDGLHDYCTECRKKSDPGRADSNMSQYLHDRRAFMFWSEGNWKLADTLYNSAGAGECTLCHKKLDRVSPDHIGPLSCGFKQNGFFEPLCTEHNSAKNRFFTYDNVSRLIIYENIYNDSVACFYIKRIWDEAKNIIGNDEQARLLSNYLRSIQQYYLYTLERIRLIGQYGVLSSLLHPEYAFKVYTFNDLDTGKFTFKSVNETTIHSYGMVSLAARTLRISFEELASASLKEIGKRKSRILKTIVEENETNLKIMLSRIEQSSSDQISDLNISIKEIVENKSTTKDEKDELFKTLLKADIFENRLNICEPQLDILHSFFDSLQKRLSSKIISEIKELS